MSVNPGVRPIETEYRGYRFRSRLEARWAVFFDQLKIRWEYEPQGFETPAGPYLPDFLLHDVNEGSVWFEVKPDGHTSNDERWGHLVAGTQRELIVAFGMSGPDQLSAHDDGALQSLQPLLEDEDGEIVAAWDGDREFCICPVCDRVGIQYQGAHGRICYHEGWERDEYGPAPGHPLVLASYAAARSARFEHGESGPGVIPHQRPDPDPKPRIGPPPARLGDLLPRVTREIAVRHLKR